MNYSEKIVISVVRYRTLTVKGIQPFPTISKEVGFFFLVNSVFLRPVNLIITTHHALPSLSAYPPQCTVGILEYHIVLDYFVITA